MKIVALLLFSILGLVSSAVALKNYVCGLEPSKNTDTDGNYCRAGYPSWSYHSGTNECVYFLYGGCHGNANRFDSAAECKEMCQENYQSLYYTVD